MPLHSCPNFDFQVACATTRKCVELLGGIGISKQFPVEKYYRDCIVGKWPISEIFLLPIQQGLGLFGNIYRVYFIELSFCKSGGVTHLSLCGIFYFPWHSHQGHSHQIEGTDGF